MSSHQRYAYQGVLRCASGWNNGIDKDTFVKSQLRNGKGLFRIAYIERNDGRLCFANLETGIAEFLQSVVGDVPQLLDALGRVFDDMECLACSSRSGGGVTCLEDVRPGIVTQPVDDLLIAGNETAN